MSEHEQDLEWRTGDHRVTLGLTFHGEGPLLLLLPAPSSISTRGEMAPLQARLAGRYTTVSVDWPGFGDRPRPPVAWSADLYRTFLADVVAKIGRPVATLAAGHAAGYALAAAAADPGSLGRLCLLSPTWRGPLPTMAGRRLAFFDGIARAVDLPVAGTALYRLNVNGPVIGMMARAHVYADPGFLSGERLVAKRRVTEAPGARHASVRFVAGALDPFASREDFLAAAAALPEAPVLVYAAGCPPKSRAEMLALAALPGIRSLELPRGRLSFYEEYPDETAEAVLSLLDRPDESVLRFDGIGKTQRRV